VAYDDGEVALHRLWQHDERVKVLNAPGEWAAEADATRARLRAGEDGLRDGHAKGQQVIIHYRRHVIAVLNTQFLINPSFSAPCSWRPSWWSLQGPLSSECGGAHAWWATAPRRRLSFPRAGRLLAGARTGRR
jgi:hypothetical protein